MIVPLKDNVLKRGVSCRSKEEVKKEEEGGGGGGGGERKRKRNEKEFVVEISFPCRVQTTGKQRSFILTQLPLPDTVVDLWRLVAESDVSMIVSLGGETDRFEVIKSMK